MTPETNIYFIALALNHEYPWLVIVVSLRVYRWFPWKSSEGFFCLFVLYTRLSLKQVLIHQQQALSLRLTFAIWRLWSGLLFSQFLLRCPLWFSLDDSMWQPNIRISFFLYHYFSFLLFKKNFFNLIVIIWLHGLFYEKWFLVPSSPEILMFL